MLVIQLDVARQMMFPGGLGQKREDWVEHWHQITARLRQQFRTTKDKGVRADAMARLQHQGTNPDVMEHMDIVDGDACHGPKKGYITKVAERKVKREETRAAALKKWEDENPLVTGAQEEGTI